MLKRIPVEGIMHRDDGKTFRSPCVYLGRDNVLFTRFKTLWWYKKLNNCWRPAFLYEDLLLYNMEFSCHIMVRLKHIKAFEDWVSRGRPDERTR